MPESTTLRSRIRTCAANDSCAHCEPKHGIPKLFYSLRWSPAIVAVVANDDDNNATSEHSWHSSPKRNWLEIARRQLVSPEVKPRIEWNELWGLRRKKCRAFVVICTSIFVFKMLLRTKLSTVTVSLIFTRKHMVSLYTHPPYFSNSNFGHLLWRLYIVPQIFCRVV